MAMLNNQREHDVIWDTMRHDKTRWDTMRHDETYRLISSVEAATGDSSSETEAKRLHRVTQTSISICHLICTKSWNIDVWWWMSCCPGQSWSQGGPGEARSARSSARSRWSRCRGTARHRRPGWSRRSDRSCRAFDSKRRRATRVRHAYDTRQGSCAMLCWF